MNSVLVVRRAVDVFVCKRRVTRKERKGGQPNPIVWVMDLRLSLGARVSRPGECFDRAVNGESCHSSFFCPFYGIVKHRQ